MLRNHSRPLVDAAAQENIDQRRRRQCCSIFYSICCQCCILGTLLGGLVLAVILALWLTSTAHKGSFNTRITKYTTTTTTSTTTTTTTTTSTTTTTTTTTSTTTTTVTTSTTTTTTSTSTITTSTTTFIVSMSSSDPIMGLWNTFAGGDSTSAIPGSGVGNYVPSETPANIFDNNCNTKYTSFGACVSLMTTPLLSCATDTGFHVTLSSGSIVLTSFQFCTGNDHPERDPLTMTLEGTNAAGMALFFGSSWSLIYNGSTGLDLDPGRLSYGLVQTFSNSIAYTSYRFLMTSKRDIGEAIQYAGIQLFT